MDSSQKLTNTDVKKLNKNRIFRLIYNSDKISRQEIADQLGLSLPTVNQNLKMLMEDGLIEYVGNFTSTGGRRAQAITINNNARKAISVNIKADYINVDVVGLKGQIIYGIILGLLTGAVRVFGNSGENIYFVLLIGNILTPLIENFTIPKPFVN